MSRYGIVSISHPWWRPQRDSWDSWFPSRIFDQNFGLGLTEEDLIPGYLLSGVYNRPRQLHNRQVSGLSEVKCEKDRFQVNLDVNQFTPNELTVKTVDNTIVVHGKHEEKSDEHGFISREFKRRYVLPEGVDPETVVSSLTHDGVLTIEAPRKVAEEPKPVERQVAIQKLEAPAIAESGKADK